MGAEIVAEGEVAGQFGAVCRADVEVAGGFGGGAGDCFPPGDPEIAFVPVAEGGEPGDDFGQVGAGGDDDVEVDVIMAVSP
jgi:hypothetical protein